MPINQVFFIAVMVFIAFCGFYALTGIVRVGYATKTYFMAVGVGPGTMFFIWAFVQDEQPALSTFTLQNMSYTAVIADLIILPVALMLAAEGYWRSEVVHSRWLGWQWQLSAFSFGLAGGAFFHFVIGGRADSSSPLIGERLHDAPLSWAHNLAVFPALLGTLTAVIVPLLATKSGRKWGISALLVALVGWNGLSAFDAVRSSLSIDNPWHFDPNWTNTPGYDWERFLPLTNN